MNLILKEKIKNNKFIDEVLSKMRIDEQQYQELCNLLKELATEWQNNQVIDKELALYLYCTPQMIRNVFLSFKDKNGPLPEIAKRLEDIWVELDALVIECLK
ncbi:MAG TPA: hypothetical protein PLZ08_10880 [Bacillota bacterium]|nr:hypothetical protein [Bacillota bacterium]HOL10913.1 hypothetical protein [Bacillota bacterium]HPO98442.1 hypothetical protein [Bacillota bacterium]